MSRTFKHAKPKWLKSLDRRNKRANKRGGNRKAFRYELVAN